MTEDFPSIAVKAIGATIQPETTALSPYAICIIKGNKRGMELIPKRVAKFPKIPTRNVRT